MIWQIGEHRLMYGNSLDPEHVDALCGVTAPPTLIFDPLHNDDRLMSLRPTGYQNVLSFTDHRRFFASSQGWDLNVSGHFVWDCQTSMYIKDCPLIRSKYCLWFGSQPYNHRGAYYGEYQPPRSMKNKRGIYNSPGRNKGKHLQTIFSSPITKRDCMDHPHSKPLDWTRLLIGNCTTGNVFDMFAGSGTTMIACQQLGRRCFAMEIDFNYCELIIERMNTLFGMEAKPIDSAITV